MEKAFRNADMMINTNQSSVRSSRRYPSGFSRPCAPPATPILTETNVVLLSVNEVQSPQNVQSHRSYKRFGVPSQNAFFCRNNPQTQRVQLIKGIHGKPVCWVNDMMLGHQPTICLGRPLTPENCLILRGKIPASAIGTNSNALPINTLTGLQFFPLKQMDSPMLKLLTDAWIDELRDLTERVGLILPSMSCRGTSPYRSPLLGCSDNDIKIQLMLIDILCQILEVKSIREVQQWLLTAGQREKDHIVSLLSNALAIQPPQLSANYVSAQEKCTAKQVPSATKMSTLNEEETQACSDPSPEALNEGRVTNEEMKMKRSCSTVTRSSQSPSRPQSRLSSPAVCHLQSPQRPVLRYSKRAITPQIPAAGSLFQEQWCNYSQ